MSEEKNNKNHHMTKEMEKIAVVILVVVVGLVFSIFYVLRNEKKEIAQYVSETDRMAEEIRQQNKDIKERINGVEDTNVHPVNKKDHIEGVLGAPIELIVYSDFECPFSASFVDILKKVREEYSGKVVIAFRHYFLTFHPNAIPAAIASECAAEQDLFWRMHDRLFELSKNGGLNTENYKKTAREIGLDGLQFDSCLDSEKYKEKIINSFTEAKRYGVTGTPASFINGEPVPGAVPFEDFTDSTGNAREGLKTIIERHLSLVEEVLDF